MNMSPRDFVGLFVIQLVALAAVNNLQVEAHVLKQESTQNHALDETRDTSLDQDFDNSKTTQNNTKHKVDVILKHMHIINETEKAQLINSGTNLTDRTGKNRRASNMAKYKPLLKSKLEYDRLFKDISPIDKIDSAERNNYRGYSTQSASHSRSRTKAISSSIFDEYSKFDTPVTVSTGKTTLKDTVTTRYSRSTPDVSTTKRTAATETTEIEPVTESTGDNKLTPPMTLPFWKTYTTINRNTSSSPIISTVNTTEKPEEPTTEREPTTPTTECTSSSTEMTPSSSESSESIISSSSTLVPEENYDSGKTEVISTKRGGYINNSQGGTNSTRRNKSKNVSDDEDKEEEEPRTSKTMKEAASRSQMIEEALLAEKRLSDKTAFQDVHNDLRTESTSSNNNAEDKTNSKGPAARNSSLYTVNPNYKPLKKIDVKTPKPYHKHPDDNSWRNESISSLGIVFNPKNSSKPLTEVLKNKTETELVYMEREVTSTEVPDLRERLEKLAELRKSKKYRTGQSSEKTDNDYEDIRSFLPSPRPFEKGSLQKNFEYYESFFTTTEATTKSPLAKGKEKIMEYYENPELNTADYFNLANIDIKKSFVKGSSRRPDSTTSTMSSADYAVSIGQFPPERKATVQYFPPRPEKSTYPPVLMTTGKYDFQKNLEQYAIMDEADPTTTEKPTPSTLPPLTTNRNYVYYETNTNEGTTYNPQTPPGVTTFIELLGKTNADDRIYNERFVPDPYQRDVINRFVENYNKNHERFRVPYPVVYNNSVSHDSGGGSRQLVQQVFETERAPAAVTRLYLEQTKAYDLNLEKRDDSDYEQLYFLPQDQINVGGDLQAPLPFGYRK
ncbi:flocculation protein FLO11 [Plutella xylostella]|uniref:flocculation protein FLO11 n=1 Tax=Plutella xylostella TaxID=51655 RepID=UPI002032E323|nr:flocculation protein FLO11 [Plutella xylostella]